MSQFFAGTCPVCETAEGFESPDGWYRDHLLCRSCGSLPRERALERFRPDGVEHLAAPGCHGNPIDASGALVSFHYGQDLSDLNDPGVGVPGAFRDVFLLTREGF